MRARNSRGNRVSGEVDGSSVKPNTRERSARGLSYSGKTYLFTHTCTERRVSPENVRTLVIFQMLRDAKSRRRLSPEIKEESDVKKEKIHPPVTQRERKREQRCKLTRNYTALTHHRKYTRRRAVCIPLFRNPPDRRWEIIDNTIAPIRAAG